MPYLFWILSNMKIGEEVLGYTTHHNAYGVLFYSAVFFFFFAFTHFSPISSLVSILLLLLMNLCYVMSKLFQLYHIPC